jgi:amino acid transporter
MGWGWLPVLTAALVSFSAVGGVLAWIAGQARLPYAVGIDRFVPPVMAKLHPRHGTPHVSIILQSALASLLMIISQAGAGVREAYLLLLDMTIVMNFIPFVYIFLALPRLRRGEAEPGVVRVPGGRGGVWLVAGLGLLATLLTLATSVVPPSDVADPRLFELKLWGGLVAFVLLGLGVFRAFR